MAAGRIRAAGRQVPLTADSTTDSAATTPSGIIREFKTSGGYDNGVEVIVGLRLGVSERRQTSFSDVDLVAAGPRMVRVVCGRTLLGLRVDDMLSVIDAAPTHVHPMPEGMRGGQGWIVGLIDCEVRAVDHSDPALVQLLSRTRLVADLSGVNWPEASPAG